MEVLPPQDGLAQWRHEQAHFAEQQELDELRRKLEAKKQHTQRWVLDQQRWEDSRPPYEHRTRLDILRGSPPRSFIPQPAYQTSPPRPDAPSQRTWNPAFGERPLHARRATDLGAYDVPRPTTPSTCPYRTGYKRSTTATAAMPEPAERTAGNYFVSPQIEEIRLQAEQWMHEWRLKDEQMRARAEAEAAKTRALQDSVNIAMRRMEDVLGPSTPPVTDDELERRRRLALAQEQRKKLSRDQRISRAFATYKNRWAALQANPPQSLTFQDIPWPTLVVPDSPASLTQAAVSSFLFSPGHSAGKSTRDRAKDALLVWHPDKFVRWLKLVPVSERAQVAEAVNIIAKHLAVLKLNQ